MQINWTKYKLEIDEKRYLVRMRGAGLEVRWLSCCVASRSIGMSIVGYVCNIHQFLSFDNEKQIATEPYPFKW